MIERLQKELDITEDTKTKKEPGKYKIVLINDILALRVSAIAGSLL